MKIKRNVVASTLSLVLLSMSSSGLAEEFFCISTQGKPKHCNEGDIILVKPTMVPRVCDFETQILRMPKSEKAAEYLCRYTGLILGVKKLKNRKPDNSTKQTKSLRPPPQKRKSNNNMFGNMPFFK